MSPTPTPLSERLSRALYALLSSSWPLLVALMGAAPTYLTLPLAEQLPVEPPLLSSDWSTALISAVLLVIALPALRYGWSLLSLLRQRRRSVMP
jgi:hypothetical protein